MELVYFDAIAITPVRYAVERQPDAGSRRVFRVAIQRTGATITSELVMAADGTLVQRTDAAPIDTVTALDPG